MNYDLAKELKDAGFPQNLDGNRQLNGQPLRHHSHGSARECDDGCIYVPTLSELIEACGDDMFSLTNCTKFWSVEDRYGIEVEGSTPEEAVARLWLALNKRKETN